MSENNDMKEENLAFYAASLEAWFATRFEHDKSLLTLSAGAIGLLLTLISTVGVSSIESLILHIFALLSFVICLAALLAIFKRNSVYLENLVQKKQEFDPLLGFLDKTAILAFMAGVVFSSIIGISAAVTKYTEKVKIMSEDKKTNLTYSPESLDGAIKMAPIVTTSEGLSVNGVKNMAPTPQPSSTGTSQSSEKNRSN